MAEAKEVRYTSRSLTPPPKELSRSRSPSRSRARSRSRSQDSRDAINPGNNLFVTGLSTRVNSSDLENYFSKEGKVQECHVVVDPRSRESRGFAFVTMETEKDADQCIKYLNRSVLEGRIITVEKAKRKRGRTPTPGNYRGARERRGHDRRRSRSYSPDHQRDRNRPPTRSQRDRSPARDTRRHRERIPSPSSNDKRKSD